MKNVQQCLFPFLCSSQIPLHKHSTSCTPADQSELKCHPAAVAGREDISWRALQVKSAAEHRGLSWYRSRAAPSSDATQDWGLRQSALLPSASPTRSQLLLAKKSGSPMVPVGSKCDAQPQLHPSQSTPRQSTPSFALVCSNILWPAKELGAGSGQEVGREIRNSHASPLLPTKTPALSYSLYALGLLFRSRIVSRAKATHALPSEGGELWKIPSQQFSKSRCNTAVLGG